MMGKRGRGQRRETGKRRPLGKLKVYADEDIDQSVVDFLRERRVNVVTAADMSHQGRDDAFHRAEAQRQRRALLTGDRDFLDHRAYPLGKGRPIIILDVPQPDPMAVGGALVWLLHDVLPSGKELDGTKVVVRQDHIDVHYRDATGRACSERLSEANPVSVDGEWALLAVRFRV